jgi:hypothetical protein
MDVDFLEKIVSGHHVDAIERLIDNLYDDAPAKETRHAIMMFCCAAIISDRIMYALGSDSSECGLIEALLGVMRKVDGVKEAIESRGSE